jgi:TRAP-type C4-dicarboxylate transport system permease small subunit
MFSTIVEKMNQWMATLSVFIIIIMMVSITVDVALRFLAGSPIVGVVELNRTLLVIVVFFTLGYAQVRKQHINVAFLINKLSEKRKILILTLNTLLALVIMAMITYGSIAAAYVSTIEGEHEVGLLNYPVWPGRIALAIGLFTLCLQYVADIYNGFLSLLKKKEIE